MVSYAAVRSRKTALVFSVFSNPFLSVINTNLPVILHCLRDIAFEVSKTLYLATPLAFKPPTEGFPGDDLRKIFSEC